MALQSSGTIKMSEINTELGRSSTATISLDTAENGGYATINTASASYPSATNPAAMSEWYSYDHNASSSDSFTMYTGSSYDGSNGACSATVNDNTTLYFGTGTGALCPQTNDTVYTDASQSTAFDGEDSWWKSTSCDMAFYINTQGNIEGEVTQCGNFFIGVVSDQPQGDYSSACSDSVVDYVYKDGSSSTPSAGDYLYTSSAMNQTFQFPQVGAYYRYKMADGTYYGIYVTQDGNGDTFIEGASAC